MTTWHIQNHVKDAMGRKRLASKQADDEKTNLGDYSDYNYDIITIPVCLTEPFPLCLGRQAART